MTHWLNIYEEIFVIGRKVKCSFWTFKIPCGPQFNKIDLEDTSKYVLKWKDYDMILSRWNTSNLLIAL